MGTKNNPGKFDCVAAAEPDEPMFTLLGRDPSASHLVYLWADIRGACGGGRGPTHDMEKTKEARACAANMRTYALNQGKSHLIATISDHLSRFSSPGQKAYDGYHGDRITTEGWDRLPEHEKEAWEFAALAVQK